MAPFTPLSPTADHQNAWGSVPSATPPSRRSRLHQFSQPERVGPGREHRRCTPGSLLPPITDRADPITNTGTSQQRAGASPSLQPRAQGRRGRCKHLPVVSDGVTAPQKTANNRNGWLFFEGGWGNKSTRGYTNDFSFKHPKPSLVIIYPYETYKEKGAL